MTSFHIAVIEGDGIGPEVTGEAVRAVEAAAQSAGQEYLGSLGVG